MVQLCCITVLFSCLKIIVPQQLFFLGINPVLFLHFNVQQFTSPLFSDLYHFKEFVTSIKGDQKISI